MVSEGSNLPEFKNRGPIAFESVSEGAEGGYIVSFLGHSSGCVETFVGICDHGK